MDFRLASASPNRQAVLRQLWAVGLLDLTASGHLIGTKQLRGALEDEAELLQSDPLYGREAPAVTTVVIPILCSHDYKHFAEGSREDKQLGFFIRTCLRPEDSKFLAWDLIESRDFRDRILDQLRRNVHEHSRPENSLAIGLAVARVWTLQSLPDEWGLTDQMRSQLLRLWDQEPVATILEKLEPKKGILQISVVDDGIGIPKTLSSVHQELINKNFQQELFQNHERLRYTDEMFNERFAGPASWPDEKARLIAFATDLVGTSKRNRAPEVKGLHYLRESAVIERHGAVSIESDGSGICRITRDQPYGQPRASKLTWCRTGGAGICLAVPMSPVESVADTQKPIHFGTVGISSTGFHAEQFKVKDYLDTRMPLETTIHATRKWFGKCAEEILKKIVLPIAVDDVNRLRREGLQIIDFGGLLDSKRVFHFLLVEIAERLSDVNPRCVRPFVFANLPKGLCGRLGNTIGKYSRGQKPMPICVFTSEQREPFWLGLDGENSIADRNQISFEIRRKITDQKENRTEAFYRHCFTQLLNSKRPIPLSDSFLLDRGSSGYRTGILQSPAFSRLRILVDRCGLFRERTHRSVTGEEVFSAHYQPIFSLGEIITKIRELFLDKFRDVFTSPPVCFTPGGNEGIRLPHSNRISARYFRSDALVDDPIAAELTRALTAIALDFAKQAPSQHIDWIVSCTSPLHWFVHQIVDGLAEYDMHCSHYVFPSYEEIPASIERIPMRSGETVLAITDVIASGQTACRMAESLVNHFQVHMAGLIAFADIRTRDIREGDSRIDRVYDGRIICLYNEPEPDRRDLRPTYYVHPETVVPKRITINSPVKEFFEKNYSGIGPLVEGHAYFGSPTRTLELMTSNEIEAIRFGHFQHGSHHSEIFVDVEKILSCRDYRNLMVTAIFRYIMAHDIRLVLYPSHSSAYILADDLKQRFNTIGETPVEFIMACRTFTGTRCASYALTRFSPHPESRWNSFLSTAVLILDDAVCSGATVESIMAELVRIDSNYYGDPDSSSAGTAKSRFTVHVVAFLNRLPRVTGDFWGGLSRVAAGRVQFSAFVTIPLAADSEETCPQCRLEEKLANAKNSTAYCLYAKEFLSWWISSCSIVSSHERRHFDAERRGRFSSKEALRLAGYLSSIERQAYTSIAGNLFEEKDRAEGDSKAVCILVRSRAGFLHDLIPGADTQDNGVNELCKELSSLIDLALDESGYVSLQDEALYILEALTVRYLRIRPTQPEVVQVMGCLFRKFTPSFGNRLLLGGVSCVLDSCLVGFLGLPQKELKKLRQSLNDVFLKSTVANSLEDSAKWAFDWLNVYLSEDGRNVSSIGTAVQTLARYAQKGRRYHAYGRSELDQLHYEIESTPSNLPTDWGSEMVKRVLASCDQFNEMLMATRALRSRSAIIDQSELSLLQDTTGKYIGQLRKKCVEQPRRLHEAEATEDEVKRLFVETFSLWFPRDGKAKPAEVIQYFLPLIGQVVKLTSDTFNALLNPNDRFEIDYTSLDKHGDLKIIIDPEVLKLTVNHVLGNIVNTRSSEFATTVLVSWTVTETPATGSGAGNRDIELVVSNTGTKRPSMPSLVLRGLRDVDRRLSEYGGRLEVLEPKSPWSFQIAIHLQRWTEVQS